jgi:hypothetical protein
VLEVATGYRQAIEVRATETWIGLLGRVLAAAAMVVVTRTDRAHADPIDAPDVALPDAPVAPDVAGGSDGSDAPPLPDLTPAAEAPTILAPTFTFAPVSPIDSMWLDLPAGLPTGPDRAAEAALAAEAAPHAELGVGVSLGTFHDGPATNCALSIEANAGLRAGRFALLGDYEWIALDPCGGPTADPPISPYAAPDTSNRAAISSVQRFGAIARYSVAKIVDFRGGEGDAEDIFLQTGASDEVIGRTDASSLHRLDINLGVGAGVQYRGQQRHAGIQVGIRADIAQPFEGMTSSGPFHLDVGGSIFVLGDFGG